MSHFGDMDAADKRQPKPSKLILEEREHSSRVELESALLSSSLNLQPDKEYALTAAKHLKICISKFEESSRDLSQWLIKHGHTQEARIVRHRRHNMVYVEARESIDDLNSILADLNLETVSSVGAASSISVMSNHPIEGASQAISHQHRDEDVQSLRSAPDGEKVVSCEDQSIVHDLDFEVNPPQDNATAQVDSIRLENASVTSQKVQVLNPSNELLGQQHDREYSDKSRRPQVHNVAQVESPRQPDPSMVIGETQMFNVNRSRLMSNSICKIFHDSDKPCGTSDFQNLPIREQPTEYKFKDHCREEPPPQPYKHSYHKTPPEKYRRFHDSTNPSYQQLVPPLRSSLDPYTKHMMKQDLLRGGPSKFNGDPQKFLSWRSNLQRRFDEIEPDSLDAIHMILANTTDRPHSMVQNFL